MCAEFLVGNMKNKFLYAYLWDGIKFWKIMDLNGLKYYVIPP